MLQISEKIDLLKSIDLEFGGKNEFIIIKDGLMELSKLEKKGVSNAKVAVENILKQEIKILDISGPKDVDDKIISSAIILKAAVATLDKGLILKAKSKGLKIIGYNKSKKKVVMN